MAVEQGRKQQEQELEAETRQEQELEAVTRQRPDQRQELGAAAAVTRQRPELGAAVAVTRQRQELGLEEAVALWRQERGLGNAAQSHVSSSISGGHFGDPHKPSGYPWNSL